MNPIVDRLAGWSWRLLVIAGAAFVLAMAAARLRFVLLPLGVAFLLATVLVPPARWLVARGLRPLLATWLTVFGFLGVLVGVSFAVLPPVFDQFSDLSPALSEAIDDGEAWLVDGPLGLDEKTVADLRERLEQSGDDALTSDGALLDGAIVAGEVVAGAILTLVISFFLVKDGPQLQQWALGRVPERHRTRARRMGAAAWSTLGHYLAGAATLGVVEGVIIGIALSVTGSDAAVPVAAITFLAAFFPFLGALVAGVLAVVVSLASSGPEAALVVAIVAVVVQQFDNELLAPLVYGRALHLHPLVVILAVAGGAAVGGFLGAFLAVPLTAVAVSVATAGTTTQSDVGADP
ncbi:AI-2E family transporter [Actinospongicola halichondriae]|uniref:AI-2E family transporter n=1 Tax=Actinospongicola halichondriae TaxID=3236844 RepID=UPI003D43BF3D